MAEGSAILLIGFGGPERREDVRPFIDRVTAGRNVPEERLQLVVDQYDQIGGCSPFLKLTRKQAGALETAMSQENCPSRLYMGMLFSTPSIPDALKKIADDGFKRAVGIIMAPHRCEASFDRYVQALEAAGAQVAGAQVEDRSGTGLDIDLVPDWHCDRMFVAAVADRVAEKLSAIAPEHLPRTRLIFTAHSVPQAMSDRSGYDKQIEETAAAVYQTLRKDYAADGVDWVVGYQSRSGAPNQPWLEPDVAEQLAKAKAAGKTHAVVVPVGFLVDHVEVLYDLDVLAARSAGEIGITMLRSGTVSDHRQFIKLLATMARHQIEIASYARP